MKLLDSKIKLTLLLGWMCLSVNVHAANFLEKTVSFYNGSFDSAKSKAMQDQKYLFVDFYADWCTPCKWMEETTFTDVDVIKALDKDFISYKVDIDKPDGYDIKNQFNIKMLPTLLIFNKKGDLVERIEETLDSKKLMAVLHYHLQYDVKKINNTPNVSPSNGTSHEDRQYLDDLYKEYKEQIAMNNRQYNAQVGIYDNYQDAFVEVNKLKEKFLEQVIVITEYKEGKTHYKVLLGEFNTIEEANSFCTELQKKYNMNAIVH